jgi:prefoldin subunit 5
MANTAAMNVPVKEQFHTSDAKFWSFIVSLLMAVGAGVGAWSTTQSKIEVNSNRIDNIEHNQNKMDGKLDRIMDKLNVIEVKVENKKDRPR